MSIDVTIAKPSDLLDEAAQVIVQRGWCRGGMMDTQGHVCGRGAIYVAAGFRISSNLLGVNPLHDLQTEAVQLVTRANGWANEVAERRGTFDLVTYNDVKGRKGTVISLLRTAAVNAREQGD